MISRLQVDPFFLSWNTPSAIVMNYVGEQRSMIDVLSCHMVAVENNPTSELFNRLSYLKDWYSTNYLPGGLPPKDSAVQDARDFVLTLPLTQMMKPSINIASDGEVNFEWKGQDFHIDLGFYGDHKFSYYARKDGQQPLFGDDIPVRSGIPRELAYFASAA